MPAQIPSPHSQPHSSKLPSNPCLPAASHALSPQGIIKHLRKVLSRHPPPAPTEAAIRLVEAVGKLQNFVHR